MKKKLLVSLGCVALAATAWMWPGDRVTARSRSAGFKIYKVAWHNSAFDDEWLPPFDMRMHRMAIYWRDHGMITSVQGWLKFEKTIGYTFRSPATAHSDDSALVVFCGTDLPGAIDLVTDSGQRACKTVTFGSERQGYAYKELPKPKDRVLIFHTAQLTNGLYYLRHSTNVLADIRVER